MEFEKSSHKDDTEEHEFDKIHERSKAPVNIPRTLPMPNIRNVAPNQSLNAQAGQPDLHQRADESKPLVRSIIKPKTELEKKIVAAKDEHPSKKIDLFKAVFASDSESDEQENGPDDTLDDSKKELLASLGKPISSTASSSFRAHLPDNPFAPKSAKELNILRNTSPPRGIFRSLIDTSELLAKARAADMQLKSTELKQGGEHTTEKDSYGPSLPPANRPPDDATTKHHSNPSSSMQSDIHFQDDWVERSSDRQSKKSKKEKKEKHRDKKEKKVKKDKHKSKKSKKDKHKKR